MLYLNSITCTLHVMYITCTLPVILLPVTCQAVASNLMINDSWLRTPNHPIIQPIIITCNNYKNMRMYVHVHVYTCKVMYMINPPTTQM